MLYAHSYSHHPLHRSILPAIGATDQPRGAGGTGATLVIHTRALLCISFLLYHCQCLRHPPDGPCRKSQYIVVHPFRHFRVVAAPNTILKTAETRRRHHAGHLCGAHQLSTLRSACGSLVGEQGSHRTRDYHRAAGIHDRQLSRACCLFPSDIGIEQSHYAASNN